VDNVQKILSFAALRDFEPTFDRSGSAGTLSERCELSGDEVEVLIARPEKAAARYQNIPSPIKFAPAARFIACAFYAPAPSQQRMQPRKT
jgi:hypothetical protein